MATVEEQVANASETGVTNFASTRPNKSDNVQVAGLGKEIIGTLGQILKRQDKSSMGSSVSKGDTTTRVPEPSTERLLGEGEKYKSVQQKLAPELLTEEGAENLKELGLVLKQRLNLKRTLLNLQKKRLM